MVNKKEGVIFVIFGATGDLTKRKLIPGIYNLLHHRGLGEFHIVGVARRDLTGENLINSAKKYIKKPSPRLISKLKKNTSYVQLDFKSEEFDALKSKITELEKKGFSNKIFYLATGSNNFKVISDKLKRSKIVGGEGWSRVVFEKPFGSDLKSSNKLNQSIEKIFNEREIYRIDHYLGKELVGNISIVRFSNQFLEPIWNRKHVDNIQITLNEKIGIEERGPFYDTYGAIKDVVQNHMLQLLALTTMESPDSFTGNSIRDKKAEILKHVKVKDTIVGQYAGYKSEKGIKNDSKTETFASLVLEINNERWRGVPIYFRTGKFLDKKETKIVINLKKSVCLFEKTCPTTSNHVEIRIFPNEGIAFELNAKIPGKIESIPVKVDFCHACTFGPDTPEGYENLFAEIIAGDQSNFIRVDELASSWKIVDKIRRGKVHVYKKGGSGPKELEAFNKKHKITWV